MKLIRQQQQRLSKEHAGDERVDALYRIVLSASRMLLVTRGIEAPTDAAVFQSFAQHFIEVGLVDAVHLEIVEIVRSGNRRRLIEHEPAVLSLSETVQQLYASMDNSLRFSAESLIAPEVNQRSVFAEERDYRGIACPMNFVKVKFNLSNLKIGERLSVLLDDGLPIENVPRSVAQEGHKVISQTRIGDFWRVEIEKR